MDGRDAEHNGRDCEHSCHTGIDGRHTRLSKTMIICAAIFVLLFAVDARFGNATAAMS